jgi:Flp pilus assembly protein TadG
MRDGQGPRVHRARGAGVFSSAFGLMFFLVFLLFAVQLLWGLYATSVVTAAAYDAGRTAARTGDAGAGAARFERTIGGYDARVDIAVDDEVVVVTVAGDNPTLLPDRWATALPFGAIDRTIRIRRETFVE